MLRLEDSGRQYEGLVASEEGRGRARGLAYGVAEVGGAADSAASDRRRAWEGHSSAWRSAGRQSGDWRSRISGCACSAMLSLAGVLMPRPFWGQMHPNLC